MVWWRTWWLPVLMGVGQFVAWPLVPWLIGAPPDPLDSAVAVVVTLVVSVALGWRRRAPAPALTVVSVALLAAQLALPADLLWFVTFGDVVVLWALAGLRPGRHSAVAVALLVPAWWAVLIVSHAPDLGFTLVLVALVYPFVATLGHRRGRWSQARAEAAARLRAVEGEQRRAAAVERERLARDLHDVTAHHLTAIVVHAGAARRLAGDRPELVAQALEFAAETGRRTLTALTRLVTVIEPAPEPLPTRLTGLAEAARVAGQEVVVEPAGAVDELPAPVADVVFAVVQEAVTNAMRYAPGAPVTACVQVSGGVVRVTVTNPAVADGCGPAGALGSGRGLAGLKGRVVELAGTFEAGSGVDGWRVLAVLPVPGRRAARWTGERVIDVVTLVGVLITPVLMIVAYFRAVGLTDGGVLLTLLVLARGVPVWWRRSAPWAALVAVLAGALAYATVILATPLPPEAAVPLFGGMGAELVTVLAVVTYARPAAATWAAALATGGVYASVVFAVSESMAADVRRAPAGVFVVLLGLQAVAYTAVLLLFVVLPGMLLRRQRERILAAEGAALREAAARAATAAHDQRLRFAAGLYASVVEPAQRLIAAAESADDGPAALEKVTAEARAGLAAMRELLGAIQPVAAGSPPRGTADLPALCAERRAAGRQVTLDAPPPRHPLPVAVDLSGYRIVDAALDTDDTGPVLVCVELIGETLRVTMTGVPGATGGPVAARIRARAAALGGKVRMDPVGLVAVHLPAPAEPAGPAAPVGGAHPVAGESRAGRGPDGPNGPDGAWEVPASTSG